MITWGKHDGLAFIMLSSCCRQQRYTVLMISHEPLAPILLLWAQLSCCTVMCPSLKNAWLGSTRGVKQITMAGAC